ncbi:MAG: isochorismatase family protein, partial [Planctomycetota bacterium]|nr:isochorismatase family protein [Planctomycetota bacterium]
MSDKLESIEHSHQLSKDRSALLVIDMQHGFLDEGASLEVPKGREVIPNVRSLLEVCRTKGMPVIFTEFVY